MDEHGFPDGFFDRTDPATDMEFYEPTRLVTHIDDGAIAAVGALYEELAIQGEVRRIGVNVNQIARALNTAVMEGKVLDLEIAYLDALRTELRAHMFTLREAFEGNLAYWAAEP